jgi:hypothetical protein
MSSALSLIGGVHVGARSLLDIKFINLYGLAISLAYQGVEEKGDFIHLQDFYLLSRRLEEGEGVGTLLLLHTCAQRHNNYYYNLLILLDGLLLPGTGIYEKNKLNIGTF